MSGINIIILYLGELVIKVCSNTKNVINIFQRTTSTTDEEIKSFLRPVMLDSVVILRISFFLHLKINFPTQSQGKAKKKKVKVP